MPLSIIVEPASEPVTTDEAKTHCRIIGNDEDTYLDNLISAARQILEIATNRAFITQTLKLVLDSFPCSRVIELEKPNLISVTHIKYYDTNGTQQTLDDDLYQVDVVSSPGRIILNDGEIYPTTWNNGNAVEIQYVAGFGSSSVVPKTIKQALLLLVGHWYSNREAALQVTLGDIPKGVDYLIMPYKVWK